MQLLTAAEVKGARPRKREILFSICFQTGQQVYFRCGPYDLLKDALTMACETVNEDIAKFVFLCHGFRIEPGACPVHVGLGHRDVIDAIEMRV